MKWKAPSLFLLLLKCNLTPQESSVLTFYDYVFKFCLETSVLDFDTSSCIVRAWVWSLLPPNQEFFKKKEKSNLPAKKQHLWTQIFPFWLISESTALSPFHFWTTCTRRPRTQLTDPIGWEFLGVRF